MVKQTDIRRYGVRPVVRQAVTTPGLPPHRGPPTSTGNTPRSKSEGRMQRPSTSQYCQPETSVAPLVFAQWNAEGLRKKKPELQEFLRAKKVDIICIQETHLTDAHRFSVRGYELFRHDRTNRPKGGIATLVRNNIPAMEVARSTGDTEFLAVKLILDKREITVVNVYSPPDKELRLHTLPSADQNLLVIGDFNAHSPSWGYQDLNSRGEETEDWMIDNSLILINKPDDKPTCLSRAWKTQSTPDIAAATDDIQKICERSVENQLGGSDHLPILLTVFLDEHNAKPQKKPSWNYKKADWTAFAALSDNICKESKLDSSENINKKVQCITECILQAAKKSIPRGNRKNYKPYWSEKLQNLHHKLTTTRSEMADSPTPENTNAYNRARVNYDETKTQEIRKSWEEKVSSLNLEKDTGKLWRLSKTLNDDHHETNRATILKENGQIYTGKQAASLLANSFKEDSLLEVPQERRDDVRRETREKIKSQLPSQSMCEPFTSHELNASIKQLKSKKAPGKDGITNEMIKHLGNYAKQKLLEIFNLSWQSGKFPDSWKEAIITPIHKKGKDRHSKTSYRPISLLSCLGKTLERMVNKRLQYHLETNNLLNAAQSGFRKNRSTEDQITLLTQDIENGFQQKMKTVAVFVDLSKAFDKVWKEGLLLKLLQKNVCGNMFRWIQSYLFHRSARVKLEGHISPLVKIREGVPQGSVISPTLFVVFIDDIAKNLSRHIPRALHADDLAVWTQAEQLPTAAYRMQEALESITAWSKEWLVTINRTKTETTCFSLSPKQENYTLLIDGEPIPHENNPIYLGVKLDRRLTWSPHINDAQKKALRKMSVMKKLAGTKWGANMKILTQVFTGSVRPHMEYASNAWATAAKTNTDCLDKIQNSSLRLITGGMKTTPISSMEATSHLSTLHERRDEKLLRQNEKMKRLPSHPLHTKLQAPTKNRLKRKSPNHAIKTLQQTHGTALAIADHPVEPLLDYEDWSLESPSIVLGIPGISNKNEYTDTELKCFTLEHLDKNYPNDNWTRVYTDGSAEDAVRNGGGGIFIRYPDSSQSKTSIATGVMSTNFRAEATALLTATKLLCEKENPPGNIVFLTDCRAVLQSLETGKGDKILQKIKTNIQALSSKSTVIMQWIPSHCGISGNEEADRLSKNGSKMEQTMPPLSYVETKTIIRSHFQKRWQDKFNMNSNADNIKLLERQQQVIIFRLRTGHCRLMSHLYRLKISHTDQCECSTAAQTPEHVLEDCPLHRALRRQIWPVPVTLQDKLWGSAMELRRTAEFIMATELSV